MKSVSHADQQQLWDEEHAHPHILLQMDGDQASSGMKLFAEWMSERGGVEGRRGIEMGCGKGRNSIWLSAQGAEMTAFDFSRVAIAEAVRRAAMAGVSEHANFVVQDATKAWSFASDEFDFAIDCFASTDIESFRGRSFARDEFFRVLKPGGFLCVYTLSTDDGFPKEAMAANPGEEKNSFIHPTNQKYEKVFDREELVDFYRSFKLIEERRVEKMAKFLGKDYPCKHFWMIFQKEPLN